MKPAILIVKINMFLSKGQILNCGCEHCLEIVRVLKVLEIVTLKKMVRCFVQIT